MKSNYNKIAKDILVNNQYLALATLGKDNNPWVNGAAYVYDERFNLYFLFGALEILLAFRLILRLTGANSFSAFVNLIYGITGVFIVPFQGIFRQATTQGVETTAVLEPATLVALVVYAVLAVGIVKLLRILSGKKQQAE